MWPTVILFTTSMVEEQKLYVRMPMSLLAGDLSPFAKRASVAPTPPRPPPRDGRNLGLLSQNCGSSSPCEPCAPMGEGAMAAAQEDADAHAAAAAAQAAAGAAAPQQAGAALGVADAREGPSSSDAPRREVVGEARSMRRRRSA
jgi:hypothetical protein